MKKTWSVIAGATVGYVCMGGPRGALFGAKLAHHLHDLVSSAANDNDEDDEDDNDDEFQGDVIEGEAIEE